MFIPNFIIWIFQLISWDAFLTHLPPDEVAAILADDNFKCIFFYENGKIPIRISLNLFPRSPIDYNPALRQVMAWHWRGNKSLPEPMLT